MSDDRMLPMGGLPPEYVEEMRKRIADHAKALGLPIPHEPERLKKEDR